MVTNIKQIGVTRILPDPPPALPRGPDSPVRRRRGGRGPIIERSKESVEISQRLSAAMGFRGIASPELAQKSGVNRQTIWRYQTGKSAPTFENMAKLAKAMKVRLDYLAYGSGRIGT